MKSTGIGDMVLATAVVGDVVRAFPDSQVTLYAGADNADLARMVEGVRVVELPAAKPWRVIPRLRADRLDAFLDLGQWTRVEALYAALSGAGWTAGFETPGQRRHRAYDATVHHSSSVRELDNYRALVATLGVESMSLPHLPAPAGEPHALLPPDPYVVFHLWPGGFRSELREWPQASWRELAERLGVLGYRVVLTGGPADADRSRAFERSCADLSPTVISVAGLFGLSKLLGVLAAARCVVSVNTGVMHMAAATGAATVGLNGPTSALRWGPVGPRAVSVDSELEGCGFLNLGFEYEGQRTDCMQGISVDRVEAAVRGLLDG